MRKLALVAVLALARLFERSAQLGFVSRRIDLLRQRFRLRSLQLPVATTATTRSAVSPTAGARLHQRYGTGRHPQQLHEGLHRGRGRRRCRCRRGRRYGVGRGPREGIVDEQLTGRVLVGLGVVLVGLLLVVVVLLLGVGLLVVVVGRNGKVLLQQNLLAGGGVAVAAATVVMAAATRAGSVAAVAAAAAVCAVGNHLRCASGVCLILQCKITKVVERPGVHYRGRHSPGIFVRWVLPAGSFPSLTAVFCSFSRFTERNWSFFSTQLLGLLELALDFVFFRTKIFHVHIHALPMLIFLLLFPFRLVLSENALFLPCCKE